MKLYTEISSCGPGDTVIMGDADVPVGMHEQLDHDVAVAHALVRELGNMRKAANETPRTHQRQLVLNLLDVLERRAAGQMTEWGFEERARS